MENLDSTHINYIGGIVCWSRSNGGEPTFSEFAVSAILGLLPFECFIPRGSMPISHC